MPQTYQALHERAHRIKYDHDEAVIRLKGPVESESIIWLCDEIDLAVDYYNYRRVDIQIDSPGGEIAALDYFMTRLSDWRQVEGLVLGTLALTRAASAAAMILSLGSIGHRRAYPSAQLLYHDSRIMSGEGTVWTRQSLDRHRHALAETDARLTRALAAHVMAGKAAGGALQVRALQPASSAGDPEFEAVEATSADELAELYGALNARDLFITPEDALGLHLIDMLQS